MTVGIELIGCHIGQWASTLNINLGHSNNQQKKLVLFSGILFFIASILTLASASIGLAKNQHQLVGLIAGLMMFVGAQVRLFIEKILVILNILTPGKLPVKKIIFLNDCKKPLKVHHLQILG